MDGMEFVFPLKEHEQRAFEYIQEFLDYKSEINGSGGLNRYNDYDQWLFKLARDLDIPNIPAGRVPANTFFFIRTSDEKIIGMINIRHRLNDFLLNRGGHIGYSIRPRERNKGYATIMLKKALVKCRELELKRVLITCDKLNIASARVIQKNHGILENEIYSETFSECVQRYWIDL